MLCLVVICMCLSFCPYYKITTAASSNNAPALKVTYTQIQSVNDVVLTVKRQQRKKSLIPIGWHRIVSSRMVAASAAYIYIWMFQWATNTKKMMMMIVLVLWKFFSLCLISNQHLWSFQTQLCCSQIAFSIKILKNENESFIFLQMRREILFHKMCFFGVEQSERKKNTQFCCHT